MQAYLFRGDQEADEELLCEAIPGLNLSAEGHHPFGEVGTLKYKTNYV